MRTAATGFMLGVAVLLLLEFCKSGRSPRFPAIVRNDATSPNRNFASITPATVRPGEPQGMIVDRIPMSKEGYEKLKTQLDTMNNDEMPKIAEAIAEARSFGDLSENAEYDAAREAQGMLQARINELQDKLARAMIVDRSTLPTDRVVFGSHVKVLDLDMKDEEVFILVGQGDEDYDQNKILLTSPIGKELVGKQVGDEVAVPIPKGALRLRILAITFDD